MPLYIMLCMYKGMIVIAHQLRQSAYILEVAKLRMSNSNLNRPLHMLIVEVFQ